MYKLQEIRQQKKLTQKELARMSDVSQRTISDIEQSTHDTTIQMLIRICLALKVTPNDLIGWQEIVENEQRKNQENLDS